MRTRRGWGLAAMAAGTEPVLVTSSQRTSQSLPSSRVHTRTWMGRVSWRSVMTA